MFLVAQFLRQKRMLSTGEQPAELANLEQFMDTMAWSSSGSGNRKKIRASEAAASKAPDKKNAGD
eukprot:890510-Pyramimonas_sp.AAC.1